MIRRIIVGSILVLTVLLAVAPVSFAQRGQPPSPTKDLPYDPHDFSGIWRFRGGGGFAMNKDAPAMTPWAQAKYDAAIPGLGGGNSGRNKPLGNDPIMVCDPVGYPRILTFGAYPTEIVQLPGRMIQFFDFFYTHRTIWTDGRKLDTPSGIGKRTLLS
jgi:hypothetical protein